MVYGVIMAGGGGARFWPLSRKENPKQLLTLSGKKPMVAETAARLSRTIKKENLFIITNALQKDKTAAAVCGEVPIENIISEPCAKNTAAAIGYAAVKILKTRGDGVIIVTPADAFIKDEESYSKVLSLAAEAAEKKGGIVTLGIKPAFAATGYGYIHAAGAGSVLRAQGFTEKPDLNTAKKYLESGEYFWNSGVFVFRAEVMLKNIARFLPGLYEGLMCIYRAAGTEREDKTVAEVYPELPSVSIDYGVMERAEEVYVVPGDFGWSDVGSWDMLGAVREADGSGNIASGDVLLSDCTDTYAFSGGRLIAALGVKGLVIAETADAVLVCPKERAQEVKKITELLEKQGRTELL